MICFETTKDTKGTKVEFDELSHRVLGCALEVHDEIGPGLLEKAYHLALAHELRQSGIAFRSEVPLPLVYKGTQLDCGYRADLLVEGHLLLELKCVDQLTEVHQAQVMTYMKLAGADVGFLINFNTKRLKHGIKRFVL